MKTIDFCIPFIGWGLRYTEFLVSNLLATASYPERISISLSAHSQNDMDLIKNSSLSNVVKRVVMARAYAFPQGDSSRGENFSTKGVICSANHCSAIQALFSQATADVVVFSDYDMAFLVSGWDQKIIEILDHHDLCGVEYPNDVLPITILDVHLSARNYQKTPNLSFLAITKKCMEAYFPQGISSFHNYLAEGGLPSQIVHTVKMAETLHLPLGSIWWMDSGCEIPLVIHNNKLRYQTFIPVAFDRQTIFAADDFVEQSSSNLPDVFVDNQSGEPFLAHYGHGTTKTLRPGNNTSFDCFMTAVNSYLAKRN